MMLTKKRLLGLAQEVSFLAINEYKGGYEDPIVVIYREIGLDEIEWMKK